MVVEETHIFNELTWVFLPGHFIMTILAFISIFGTINIVLATWNAPYLHGTCNYLIALNAIADSCHQLTQIIHGVIMFTKDGYMTRLPCTYWNTVSLIGANTAMLGVFIIGVDRLFSVVTPTIYRNANKTIYHIFIAVITVVINGILLGLIYDYAINNPNELVLPFF
uniref:G-protein coupled receptors family 1 profile domain-containing protein n=1 Tax=Panagrolaimus davidi TaxID=227884 RepID=A0A914QU65_9BILA